MKIVLFDPYFETLGGGEKVMAVMAEHLSAKHEVTILVKKLVNKKRVEPYFSVDLSKVKFELIPEPSAFVRALQHIWFPGRWKSILTDRAGIKALQKIPMDLFINGLYMSSMPSPAPRSVYMCMFPQKLQPGKTARNTLRRVYNSLTDKLETWAIGSRRDSINSYTIVTANSSYTAGWIKKYWNRKAMVIFPPCDDNGPPARKKNIILSVGRFFADTGDSHHKRHDEMIKAFIKLGRNDWQLHLAGSAAQDDASKAYLTGLYQLVEGHNNIFLHPNIPGPDINRLRRQAAIYWHATGLGYDANKFPENQEHFGMVTAEAMSAGAVPVVYRSAGQMEVVDQDVNGLLWSTPAELIKQTSKLLDNPKLRQKLSAQAVEKARQFDRQAFVKRVDQLILEVEHD